jgi:hypothetical protein
MNIHQNCKLNSTKITVAHTYPQYTTVYISYHLNKNGSLYEKDKLLLQEIM